MSEEDSLKDVTQIFDSPKSLLFHIIWRQRL